MRDHLVALSILFITLLFAPGLMSDNARADDNVANSSLFSFYIGGGVSMPLDGPLRSLDVAPAVSLGVGYHVTERLTVMAATNYFRYGGYIPDSLTPYYYDVYSGGVRHDILYGLSVRLEVSPPGSSRPLPDSLSRVTRFLVTIGTGLSQSELSEAVYMGESVVPSDSWHRFWWSAGLAVERRVNPWAAICIEGRFIMMSNEDLKTAVLTFGARLW